MADIAISQVKRNEAGEVTPVNGAATATIPYARSDENIVVHILNAGAQAAAVTFVAAGVGAGGLGNLAIADIAQNDEFAVVLESSRFKNPTTQKVTVTTAVAEGGSVANVKFRILGLPKALVD